MSRDGFVTRYSTPETRAEAHRRADVRVVLKPCVPVQDAAEEAARSSSDHTDMADEQAGTQALPLCRHGYYAARCPHCQEDAA